MLQLVLQLVLQVQLVLLALLMLLMQLVLLVQLVLQVLLVLLVLLLLRLVLLAQCMYQPACNATAMKLLKGTCLRHHPRTLRIFNFPRAIQCARHFPRCIIHGQFNVCGTSCRHGRYLRLRWFSSR